MGSMNKGWWFEERVFLRYEKLEFVLLTIKKQVWNISNDWHSSSRLGKIEIMVGQLLDTYSLIETH
jgi:hypothetical protein